MRRPPSQPGRITTALLLAAGTGSRLQPLTDDAPKCLTEVNDVAILERLVDGLRAWGFERLVVVVGHQENRIREFLDELDSGLEIEYVYSEKYRTTNNIYSLWMARDTIQEPFLLLECDLIFDEELLGDMLQPDRMAVSQVLPWMNGTMVSLDHSDQVVQFHLGGDLPENQAVHKTVNMYSFSRESWQRVSERLDQYISADRVKGYYEAVFAEMVEDGGLTMGAVVFDQQRWYEVDTLEDLHAAEELFAASTDRQNSAPVGP